MQCAALRSDIELMKCLNYYQQMVNILWLYFCFPRFLPSVLLQHVEDTMGISRLKWTVQAGGRVTSASTLILDILSGKVVDYVPFQKYFHLIR